MAGELTSWIVGILLVGMALAAAGGFYVSGTGTPGNPGAYPVSGNVTLQFTTALTNVQTQIKSFQTAIQTIQAPQTPILSDLTAYVTAGVAIFQIMLAIPQVIGGFFWDCANAIFQVLPTDPSGTLVAIVGYAILIPAVLIMMVIIGMIRPPPLVMP